MRLVDLDALLQFPIRWNHYDKEHGSEKYIFGVEAVIEYAENLPIIDAETVKHGHWEWFYNEPIDVNGHMCYSYGYRCSICREGGTCWIGEKLSESAAQYWKNIEPVDHKYCPDCGARMDLEELV